MSHKCSKGNLIEFLRGEIMFSGGRNDDFSRVNIAVGVPTDAEEVGRGLPCGGGLRGGWPPPN
jgi:hypothetical protein